MNNNTDNKTYEQSVPISVIYLNNCYEVPLNKADTMQDFLSKAGKTIVKNDPGYTYVIRNERGVEIKDALELRTNCYFYIMILSKSSIQEEKSSISSLIDEEDLEEIDEDDEEESEGLCMSISDYKSNDNCVSSVTCRKLKRPKGQKRHFVCPFDNCRKIFTETGNLKTHLRTHTGERPFTCIFKECKKSFITKGHLKSHELIHTGDKPFVCDFPLCNKMYSRSGRLKIHRRTHTGERPFICPIKYCTKSFTEKGNLKTHLRIHSGEKPYRCSYVNCSKTFTTQGHLTDHQRRHSGERPFQCALCGRKFMRSSTLKIHYKRHGGGKIHRCRCNKLFSDMNDLAYHMKMTQCVKVDKYDFTSESLKTEKSEESYDKDNIKDQQIENDEGFISATVKLMERNQRAKQNQIKREASGNTLNIPMALINQHSQTSLFPTIIEPKAEALSHKSPTHNSLEARLLSGLRPSHSWAYGINTPNTTSNLLFSPTPFVKSIPFFNFCSGSPLGNVTNSPMCYLPNGSGFTNMTTGQQPVQKENTLGNSKDTTEPSNRINLQTGAQSNISKKVYTPLAGKYIMSPTFSPFCTTSPDFFNMVSTNQQPSFSMLASFYDINNQPETPMKDRCEDKLTTRHAVPEYDSPIMFKENKKNGELIHSLCSTSTKTPKNKNNMDSIEFCNDFSDMRVSKDDKDDIEDVEMAFHTENILI